MTNEMNLQELRRLAERAVNNKWSMNFDLHDSHERRAYQATREAFQQAANPATLLELLDALAAANARVGELEKVVHQRCDDCSNRLDSFQKHIEITDLKFKLELAEAQAAVLIEAYCGECDYDHEICRGTQPDMQCAVRVMEMDAASALLAELQRYREALREIYEIEAETNYDEDCSGMKFGTSTESPTEIQKIVNAALSASSSAPTAGEHGAPPETRMIKINGHAEVNVSHEEFMDKFIAFIEANGWTFGGVTEEVRE